MHRLPGWLLTLSIFLVIGCTGNVNNATDGGQDSSDAGGDAGGDGDQSSAPDGNADQSQTCNLDSAVSPWPDWVPAWPGSGRNATGNTTFQVLSDGSTISNLHSERLSATSVVVVWNTPGDCDSTIAWGTSASSCPTGYHRSGARREHRLLVAPLQPSSEYHITVRSRDNSSEDLSTLTITTTALEQANQLSACGEITSPGNYRLVADVSADCTCFNIQADSVHLDLGWHTVTYAQTTTSQQCHGVYANADNLRVSSGIVVQGSAGGDLYSHALAGRGAVGLEFDQIWLRVHTSDAFGLRTMYSQDVSVHDLVVVSEVRNVTDRHYPGNRGIGLDLSPEDALGEVYDCILFGVPHWGIVMTADDRLQARPAGGQTRRISNNHIFADMHATNGYAIGIAANHIEVNHNEIRPLHNGRAIHYTRSNGLIHHNIVEALELIEGDPLQGYAYYSDSSDEHSPHDPSVCSWVVAHGIRVEGGNYGEIANNEVYVFSLAQVSFGSTALNINTDSGARGGNEVHHNQFSAYRADNSIQCSGGPIHTVAGWVRGEPPVEPADLHHNRFASNGDILDIEDPALATSTDNEEVGL
ncbi:MAG: hypothetical protein JRJ87_14455 [Deltaproteobacteria bacterium]|nr:hypothetical protein [Deltaproteobacteria bacterium]